MYVGLDKAASCGCMTTSKMRGPSIWRELREQHDALPVLERPWLASRIELMETTDMAVVV